MNILPPHVWPGGGEPSLCGYINEPGSFEACRRANNCDPELAACLIIIILWIRERHYNIIITTMGYGYVQYEYSYNNIKYIRVYEHYNIIIYLHHLIIVQYEYTSNSIIYINTVINNNYFYLLRYISYEYIIIICIK